MSLERIILTCGLALLFCFPALHAYADSSENEASRLVFDASKNTWVKEKISSENDGQPNAVVYSLNREVVAYPNNHSIGTIIINTGERRLYRMLDRERAVSYPIGVGREGFAWKGSERISRKNLWPTWTPPKEMRVREAKQGRILPIKMEGGPDNPMGARALYLGGSLYRIHGTNQPWSIGKADSSGCIRMTNEDVIHLYETSKLGDLVIVR